METTCQDRLYIKCLVAYSHIRTATASDKQESQEARRVITGTETPLYFTVVCRLIVHRGADF